MKKLLIVMNPVSGKLKGVKNKELIERSFSELYDTRLMLTERKGDGTRIAAENVRDFDMIAACGGDGTINEVMEALLALPREERPPLYCIPAGTTNLLGDTLGFPKQIPETLSLLRDTEPHPFDVGFFGDICFGSVVSFGAFTDSSYATSQKLKNTLGYGAYVFGGTKSLFNIKDYHMKIISDEVEVEDDFIFGAISNCNAVGGIIRFQDDTVQVNDGVYEVMLIKKIHSIGSFFDVVRAVTSRDYSKCPSVVCFQTDKVRIETPIKLPWTIDGEYKGDFSDIDIRIEKSALDLYY